MTSAFASRFQIRRTALKQHSSGFFIGIIVSVVLGFGIIAGVLLGLRSAGGLGYEPGVWKATQTAPGSATLAISTFPDSQVCHADAGEPKVDWVTYCPSTNFQVPANSLITVVISNYDSSTALINDYFREVHGTIGGVEMVNNKPVSEVDAGNIAHTFTLQSVPNAAYPIFVSVPLVGTPDNAPTPITINGNSYPKPNIISFQFRTGPAGTYIWHCYDPCGDGLARKPPYGFSGPMSTTGYMAGTMTVV
jgi:hypothetical protein